MSKFKVRFVEGSSSGTEERHLFMGARGALLVEAANRAEAYIRVFKHLSQSDNEVTVIPYVEGQATPLGFTEEERAIVRSAGVPIKLGLPKNGFQIEEIVIDGE